MWLRRWLRRPNSEAHTRLHCRYLGPVAVGLRRWCLRERRSAAAWSDTWMLDLFRIRRTWSLYLNFGPPGIRCPLSKRRGRRLEDMRITCPIQRSCLCSSMYSAMSMSAALWRVSAWVTLCHHRMPIDAFKTAHVEGLQSPYVTTIWGFMSRNHTGG